MQTVQVSRMGSFTFSTCCACWIRSIVVSGGASISRIVMLSTTICSHAALARAQRAHPGHCHWLAQYASQNKFKHHRKQNGTHKCPIDASTSNGIGTVFPLRDDPDLPDCGTRQQSSKEKLDVSSLLLVNVFLGRTVAPTILSFSEQST